MSKRAIIFVGIQASGKSTFYTDRLMPLGYTHISMDTLHNRSKEQQMLEHAIMEGADLVIDNTNPTREDRQRYIPKLKDAGYTIECYFFQSRILDCVERNARRERQVLPTAIAATSNKLEMPSRAEGFEDIKFVRITPEGFETTAFIEEEKQ